MLSIDSIPFEDKMKVLSRYDEITEGPSRSAIVCYNENYLSNYVQDYIQRCVKKCQEKMARYNLMNKDVTHLESELREVMLLKEVCEKYKSDPLQDSLRHFCMAEFESRLNASLKGNTALNFPEIPLKIASGPIHFEKEYLDIIQSALDKKIILSTEALRASLPKELRQKIMHNVFLIFKEAKIFDMIGKLCDSLY